MSYQIHLLEGFLQQLNEIEKKFPKATTEIEKSLNLLKNNPTRGQKYPGFGQREIRKLRIGLKKYGISKRKGLRLIYAVKENKIIPLLIYHKSDFNKEHKILQKVSSSLANYK